MPWITLCLQKVYIVKTISCQSLLSKRVNIRIFQENIKRLKTFVERDKESYIFNNLNHAFLTAITVDNETISNSPDIESTFNNDFAKVPIDIKSSDRIFMIFIF